ncbi:hypothetical protein ACWTQY_31675, partial [Klebsiella pneumoniae]
DAQAVDQAVAAIDEQIEAGERGIEAQGRSLISGQGCEDSKGDGIRLDLRRFPRSWGRTCRQAHHDPLAGGKGRATRRPFDAAVGTVVAPIHRAHQQ